MNGEYRKIISRFWTGNSGLTLKKHGQQTLLLALYLMTNPHGNMYGLFYLPRVYIANDTTIPVEQLEAVLDCLEKCAICKYDRDTENIFIAEAAHYQIGQLVASDNRHKQLLKDIGWLRKMPFFEDFHERYRQDLNLPPLEDCRQLSSVDLAARCGSAKEPAADAAAERPPAEPDADDPQQENADSEVLLVFPCAGRIKEYCLTARDIKEWAEALPNVDILAECRKALAWIKVNNCKTAKRMPNFLVRWCSNAFDQGHAASRNGARPTNPFTSSPDSVEAARQRAEETRRRLDEVMGSSNDEPREDDQ
jgi:hypothetical protein